MGTFKVIPKEIKTEILAKVKQGEKVLELARQYAVSDKSIYTWLQPANSHCIKNATSRLCETILIEVCLHKMGT